jgi:hypothetical protein
MDVTDINITKCEEISYPKKYKSFLIAVKGNIRTWTVSHRFSDFEKLQRDLGNPKLPYQLPPKAIFLSPEQLVERQLALNHYLKGIVNSEYKAHPAWLDFLNVPVSNRFNVPESEMEMFAREMQQPIQKPAEWHQQLSSLEQCVVFVRKLLYSRHVNGPKEETLSKHEISKAMRLAKTWLQKLEASLNQSAIEQNLQISSQESLRRSNLLLKIKSDLETLEREYHTPVQQMPVPLTKERKELLGISSTPTRSTRVFGKETAETVNLDDSELLALQRQKMAEQDQGLELISKIISRQKEIALTMSDELDYQNQLLNEVDEKTSRVNDGLALAEKKIKRLK